MTPFKLRYWAMYLLGTTLFTPSLTAAGESPKRQSALVLARVLSYEKTLDQRVGESVSVAVVYHRGNPASEANAGEWFTALNELASTKVKEKRFSPVKIPFGSAELAAAIDRDGIDVLFASDGLSETEVRAIAQLARAKHVLTASNSVANLDSNLTLCVLEEAAKTKIFINLNTAKLEGIEFSSRLLKLVTLVH